MATLVAASSAILTSGSSIELQLIATEDGVLPSTDDAVQPVKRDTLTRLRQSLFRRSGSSISEDEYVDPAEELVFLEVRPWVFGAVWWVMIVIHICCAMILSLQSRLYIYLQSPYMSYYVNLLEPGIASMYPVVAGVFGVIAVMHWSVVLRLIYYSLSQRKYAFFPASHDAIPVHRIPADKVAVPLTRWQRFRHGLHAFKLAVFGRRGVLGPESRFFYANFYIREAIELTSQIYQAYRASLLVSRTWVSHLSVAVIAVNCFSTPLIQFVYKRRPEVRRIALLAIDAHLDFIMAMVIPIGMFIPYYWLFDTTTMSFPTEKVYDETWFIQAILENQELYMISTMDMLLKCVPHVSITSCLKKVRALIRKDTSVVSISGRVVTRSVVAPSERKLKAQEKLARINAKKAQKKQEAEQAVRVSSAQVLTRKTRAKLSWGIHKYAGKLIRLVFLSIAFIIVALHLLAFYTSYRSDKSGCLQPMRPWFATKFACSVYRLDCRYLNTTGRATDITAALQKLYAPAVVGIGFVHCSALEIPDTINEYNHLMRLDMYNSTLIRWGASAALTRSSHPVMAAVSFARVQFSNATLPDGMLSDEFPDALMSIELSTTNLASLPSDLHKKWPRMTKLYVEHSQLTAYPTTLMDLDVEKLSLSGNQITALPSTWGSRDIDRFELALAQNPLMALPDNVHEDTSIAYLFMHETKLSSFTSWITTNVGHVYAEQTPFCEAQTPVQRLAEHHADAQIACAMSERVAAMVDVGGGLYPLALIDRIQLQEDAREKT
ncbi:hypothetical protein Poli38472_001034 [Pythium oligandrum]|uniref:Uncharacterized protein n=1 Tax=Pythium oligandrum TaxID=41045 RepID=A0A8K1FST6_PYTOL|nr:hypothetical protein Poli38472_001034 [Pythium oligandrum]|eukprot:TMW68878.1 hypothetical protein Poli38472_001034 [Pythium oligandrum]